MIISAKLAKVISKWRKQRTISKWLKEEQHRLRREIKQAINKAILSGFRRTTHCAHEVWDVPTLEKVIKFFTNKGYNISFKLSDIHKEVVYLIEISW